MVQHKMKKKATLPAGAKQKSMKRIAAGNAKSKGQKKGMSGTIAPKKAAAVCDAKISTEVSKMINQKNEELLRARADRDVGKTKNNGQQK